MSDATDFPKELYVRMVEPGTDTQWEATSADLEDLTDDNFGDQETVSPNVARYVLAGTGSIHSTEPVYVEDATT